MRKFQSRLIQLIPKLRPHVFIISTTSMYIAYSQNICLNDQFDFSNSSVPVKTLSFVQTGFSVGNSFTIELLYNYFNQIFVKSYNFLRDLLEMSFRLGSIFLLFSPSLFSWPIVHLIRSDFIYNKWWDILRSSIRLAGPCLSKFAQWISTRPDLFPYRVCKELEILQSNGIQHNSVHSKTLIKNVFGSQKEKDLTICELRGSGCVAQVYHGVYKDKDVAIKVIHPHARASIQRDLKILKSLGEILGCIPGISFLCISESIDEFSKLMLGQLNMQSEAASLRTFTNNFSAKDWKEYIVFPQPLNDILSSSEEDVLVESFETGQPMTAYLGSDVDSDTKKELAKLGLQMFMKMVFEDNFMHSDLHPGNMLVRRAKGSDGHLQIVVLDAGLVTSLSPSDRRNFIDLFHAIVDNNGVEAAKLMILRSQAPQKVVDQRRFEEEVDRLVKEVHQNGLHLGRIDLNIILKTLLISCYNHNVRLDPNFTSVLLSIGILEGLGKRLDPDLNVLFHAAPFILHSVYAR